MGPPAFIHTHIRTEYSIVEGLCTIPGLVQSLIDCQMPSAAVTEKNNMFSAIKFYEEAKNRGIKPIIGCNVTVRTLSHQALYGDIVLLCMNKEGYLNLNKLVTGMYDDASRDKQLCTTYESLEKYNGGLIALSGGVAGDIAKLLLEKNKSSLMDTLDFWERVFGNRYYIEVYDTGREYEKGYLAQVVKLASQRKLAVVATNDVVMLSRSDFKTHEAKFCIQTKQILENKERKRLHTEEQYLKTEDEMKELFRDFPEILENSVEIAKRCNLVLEYGEALLPRLIEEDAESTRSQMHRRVEQGLINFRETHGTVDLETYRERVDYELEVIGKMNYEGYFLIVSDFIAWARKEGIPVGPGRGSGAGSLVAYLLGITEIDPLEHNLLFERFLNPERISMPDFDIDFCIKGRDRVIDYVAEQYGKDKVSHINTFSSFGAKGAIRDIGRVLNVPYNKVNEVVSTVPNRLNICIEDALKESSEFNEYYRSDKQIKQVIDLAKDIEGLKRNPGRHAGGVVISPSPLIDYTALYREENESTMVSQFDMKDIEKVGLIKFDFLGLKTLTIIEETCEALKEKGYDIDFEKIGLADPKTYQLLQSGKTTAIFQLESTGIQELIKELHPDKFDDLVALLALYRPGPLGANMGETYVKCKRGAEISYLHPLLKPILKSTYGVILYQEQVMEIARTLAGYTLASADILRRAMGKKNQTEMAEQRTTFIAGALKNGIEKDTANKIFDLMEHFAGYGFNKSHSVAYATIAYRSAWLKANYPQDFMAAVLTEESDTDKIGALIDECRSLSIKVLAPDINRSTLHFRAIEDGILYGLESIRNVGCFAMQRVIQERKENGRFESLMDFCFRMATRIKKSEIEVLIQTGSFDNLDTERGKMLANLLDIYSIADQEFKNKSRGQSELFGDQLSSPIHLEQICSSEDAKPYSEEEILNMERVGLGRFLTGHPINHYVPETKNIADYRLGELIIKTPYLSSLSKNKFISAWVVGVIMDIRHRTIKGKRSAFFSLDDGSGVIDVAIFDNDYETCCEMLIANSVVAVEVYRTSNDIYKENNRWRARDILEISQVRKRLAQNLFITLSDGDKSKLVPELKDTFASYLSDSGCPVVVSIATKVARIRLVLGDEWCVDPCQELIEKLRSLSCVESAQVSYRSDG